MSEILSLREVGVSFAGRVAVKDISFSLEAGESLAVIGPNGAGKTVLLRAMLGLARHSGDIRWAASARLGYVPQKIDADRHLPIDFENLFAAKAALSGAGDDDRARVVEAVGLERNLLTTPVGKLSGGQFQRALLAFALLGRPNVLLLDEPTASIDESGQERFYELIHRLQRAYAMTVILVSHDLSMVYNYASRVLCINRTAICMGPPQEILTPAAMEQLFGGRTKYYHTVHQRESSDGA